MKVRSIAALLILTGLIMSSVVARAQDKPAIGEEVRGALQSMGKTLGAGDFAFRSRTIREYNAQNGQPLHIFHNMSVVVRRPDRMLADVTGDDGATKIFYDGKAVTIFGVELNKYVAIPASGNIEDMLRIAVSTVGIDFPLADFLVEAPDKAFLSGVTSGFEVGTVTIDGTPARHLLFTQPPGIELELWLEKNDRALPRRLIVTYRSLPGEPRFIAEMSDWNFAVHPSDAEFAFHPPAGATKVDLEQEKAK